MKKLILILAGMTILAGTLNSQPVRPLLGVRAGYDAQEVSYLQPFTRGTRLELTLGVNTFDHNQAGKLCRGVGLNGIYQWVNTVSPMTSLLKWYLGVGAAVLDHGSLSVGKYGAGVLGQIGVEYTFISPWQLSLDYRPGFYWLPGAGNIYRFSWNAPCVALRYQF